MITHRTWLLWLGLAAAFSPVLLDLIENFTSDSQHAYSLLALVFIALLLRHPTSSAGTVAPRAGAALLTFGLLLQILGIAAGSWSIARSGLPIGALGIALITGRPGVPVVMLAFGLVPVPGFLTGMASPTLESALGQLAGGVVGAMSAGLEVGGPLLEQRGRRFELFSTDGGVVTAFLLAEAGWYAAARAGCSVLQCLMRALPWALLAVVLQPLLAVACVAFLPLGAPGVGRFLLTHGVWLMLGLGAIAHHFTTASVRNETQRMDHGSMAD